MKQIFFFLVFLIASNMASQALSVQIDSISHQDLGATKRKYTISYHIENRTDKPVSFYFYPNTLIANAAGSMALYPVYKIYQNAVFEDMDGPFFENRIPEIDQLDAFPDYNSPEAKAFIEATNLKYRKQFETILADYKKNGGTKTDNEWIYENYVLKQSMLMLQPREKKAFTIKTAWNKVRTVKKGDLEFHLSEHDHYAIELTLHLSKSFVKDQLSEAEFAQIDKDPNYIEGNFVSNKMEISFK